MLCPFTGIQSHLVVIKKPNSHHRNSKVEISITRGTNCYNHLCNSFFLKGSRALTNGVHINLVEIKNISHPPLTAASQKL